jgi:hypothetical protein
MEHKKLDVGEKYLSIKLVGHAPVVAFKNKTKQSDQSPDYVGNGIAVWIQTKKASDKKVEESKVEESSI